MLDQHLTLITFQLKIIFKKMVSETRRKEKVYWISKRSENENIKSEKETQKDLRLSKCLTKFTAKQKSFLIQERD